MPPPLPLQAVSEATDPSGLSVKDVPPTATTFCEVEGQITPAPLSPVDEKKTTP